MTTTQIYGGLWGQKPWHDHGAFTQLRNLLWLCGSIRWQLHEKICQLSLLGNHLAEI